ncbi:hypothetical protein [Dyadobacter pollutisoli]|uniref:Uncharacterized protein n=1 Tax=Dyadobacter pollutisoli TaxID=2910158 RepID=A0A9E8SMS2_9BACT|nr:hypothetical protein [Dyadobacter pollutisoli]WAC13589.1 hypothetical protein ON006_06450 [Dyadobacter pollutisoli]
MQKNLFSIYIAGNRKTNADRAAIWGMDIAQPMASGFRQDYEGKTLRKHLGAPDQYGIDPAFESKKL